MLKINYTKDLRQLMAVGVIGISLCGVKVLYQRSGCMTDKERFDKFKKDLPKESYAIIIKDSEHGLSEFMAYDTTEGSEVTFVSKIPPVVEPLTLTGAIRPSFAS